MSSLPSPRRRARWVAGAAVLAALLGTVAWMLARTTGLSARLSPATGPASAVAPAAPPLPPAPVPIATTLSPAARPATTGPLVRGVVRLPGGEPAEGCSVVVHRMLTAWPEWRRERVDEATSGVDGSFQFRVADAQGLLLGFSHPRFAGGLVEVPGGDAEVELRLQPGFPLFGVVRNTAGAPVAGARVAVEAAPGDDRLVEVTTTGNDGRYGFANLAAGPVRIVARHPAWQPVAQPAVVVGDQRRVDLEFERPSAPPLRGRVVRAGSDEGLGGALVQLLPLSGRLGLVDAGDVRTGPDGAFEVSGLPRGSMRFVVRHPDHGAVITTKVVSRSSAGADAQAGADAGPALTVELPRRSVVGGRLRAEGAAPWTAGAVLRIRDYAGQLAFTEVAADGAFRFAASLSPGVAQLRVADASFAFQRSEAPDLDVRIDEAPTTQLDLVVVQAAVARGRVVDDQGAPVAGATVTRTKLLSDNARTLGDAAAQLDLGAIGSQVVQLFAATRDEVVATTDARGVFEVRGAKGASVLRVAGRGFGSRLLRLDQPTQDFGDVVMPRGCRLQGRVLRGLRPLAGATVLVIGARPAPAGRAEELLTQAMVVTDGNGAFRVDDLMPGNYRVRARLPSQPSGSTRTVTVNPRMVTSVDLPLGSGRRVQGVVTGSDGEPLAGAVVSVRGAFGMTAYTDERGDFLVELPERDVELQVALPDRSRSTTVVVPLRERSVAVRLDTPPTCTLTARLAGLPGRRPLAAVLLRFVPPDGGDDGGRSVWVETPEGELRYSSCPTGRFRVELWGDGHAPLVLPERDLLANDTVALGDLLLEPGCRLVGVVVDPAGKPVANAAVLLGEESDLDLLTPRTRTQADGSFRLQGATGRASRLVVQAQGFAPRVVDLELPRDLLAPTPLLVRVEPGASLVVSLAPGLLREGGMVHLRRDGRFVASAEADELGLAVFDNRSAGIYSVHLVGNERVSKRVPVEAGTRRVVVRLP